MTKWIIVTLTALGLAGCDTSTSAQDEPLVPSGTYELQVFELSSGQAVTVPDPSRYTLTFLEDSRISARVDCNVCNGSYQLGASGFDVGLLACTLAACPPGSLERPYIEALEAAFALELRGQELLVSYPDGVLRYRGM